MEHTSARDVFARTAEARRYATSSVATLLQLHSEFTRSCFAISIVGSVVNALNLRKALTLDPASIAGYLPARPLLSSELARDLIQSGVGDDLCRASFAVGDQLQLCVDLSHAYTQATHKRPASIEPLSDAWQRLANACFVLEYMIDLAIQSAGADKLKPSRVKFGPLLRQIGAGSHPCVDDQGVICLPGWAERRQASRTRQVTIPAVIEIFGECHEVEISDISSLGVGLIGAKHLRPGETFILQVGRHARTKCDVRWSDDNRSGALFETPLHRIDLEAILSTGEQVGEFTLDKDRRTWQEMPPYEGRNRETSVMDYIETPAVIEARMRR